MRRGEEHFIAARTKESARCLAGAGRDAVTVAAFEIEEIDLVEGILGLAFALEDERLAVR